MYMYIKGEIHLSTIFGNFDLIFDSEKCGSQIKSCGIMSLHCLWLENMKFQLQNNNSVSLLQGFSFKLTLKWEYEF
jgi:hypothetical protein